MRCNRGICIQFMVGTDSMPGKVKYSHSWILVVLVMPVRERQGLPSQLQVPQLTKNEAQGLTLSLWRLHLLSLSLLPPPPPISPTPTLSSHRTQNFWLSKIKLQLIWTVPSSTLHRKFEPDPTHCSYLSSNTRKLGFH